MEAIEDMRSWIIGIVICGIVAGWRIWRKKKEVQGAPDVSCRVPRGSMGWPLIGESLEFIACGRASKPLSFMHKRRALYGKVFKSHLFGRPIIISTDSEVNKMVLQNDSRTFVPFYPKSIIKLLGEYSMLQMNEDQHKRLHGLVGGFLKSRDLKKQIIREIERAVELSLRRWKDSKHIYIQDETKEITFQVLVRVLFSIRPGEEMEFLKREFREFIKGLICLPINLPGTRLHKSLKAKERIMKLIKKILEEKMNSNKQEALMDVADVLLKEMNDAPEQRRLTVDSISSNILEMMIPGDDSVPMLMTLAVKFLSENPSALKDLVEENVQLRREKELSSEPYTCSDYMSLPFTHNVINETLRMGNIINAVWRKALKDVDIKGYKIPKGWCVLASFTSIHFDQENFENPYEFDPWRWQRKEKIVQSTFTPFSGGQRLCPGMEFTRLEVAVFLHHFVTNFRWEAEEDTITTFPTVKTKKRLPITLFPIPTSYN